MTLRRALLALSLVAVAASAAASPSQPAPSPAPPAPSTPSTEPPPQPPTASPAGAELPVDPIAIAFDTSNDHDAEDAAGPKLLKYVIDFVPAAGAPGKTHTLDLGKPKPVNGSISVPLTKVLVPGTYFAHVRSVGRSLQATTVTVGPFVITEKLGKTKADIDKELRESDKSQPQDKRIKKPKGTQSSEPPPTAAPPAPASPPPPNTEPAKGPAGKGGFWKKFYEKVVG